MKANVCYAAENVARNECVLCVCVESKVASLGLSIWKMTNYSDQVATLGTPTTLFNSSPAANVFGRENF